MKGAGGVENEERMTYFWNSTGRTQVVELLGHQDMLLRWKRKDDWNEKHRGRRESLRELFAGLETFQEKASISLALF